MGSTPPDLGTKVADLTNDEICKRDGDRLERLRSRPTNDEAARFAGELGCEKLRPQLLGLMESLGYAAPTPAAAELSNDASTDANRTGRADFLHPALGQDLTPRACATLSGARPLL